MKTITVTEAIDNNPCWFTFDTAGITISGLDISACVAWDKISDVEELSVVCAELKVKHFKEVVVALGNYSRIFSQEQFD